ncbi:LysM peptidoglycan-binding domain-containing protein, partial [bacterium]|nr:LysM peptidoglycan-binding domain-containing protein [bacterium]
DCNTETNNNYIEVKLNEISDTLHFFVDKTKPEQNFFEFYGLIIESQFDNGILYSSAGINGAGYASILKQNLFVEQIDTYKPDLVVIDLGGNDFYKQAFNYSSMEKMLMTIINKIRTASPNSLIIINSSQNFYRRNYNVAECKNFSELTRNVAFKNNCVFYDYYRVSGGDKAMLKWLGAKLAKRDKVHLTNEGYHLKADLFMNAILNSYKIWLNNQYLDSLLAFNFALDSADLVHCFPKNDFRKNTVSKVVADKKENKSHFQKITNTGSAVEYTIKKGDNLGSIAEKFDVSVSNLKSWNNLSSNKIIAGKKLIVYSDVKNTPPSTQTNNNSIKTKQIKHKVKSGESLWIIARKYNTTVDNIKKLNNLKNDNLKPGIVLIIK